VPAADATPSQTTSSPAAEREKITNLIIENNIISKILFQNLLYLVSIREIKFSVVMILKIVL